MADFLTRLAGRTLGVAPTVQPRIASIYAPGSTPLAGQSGLPVFEEEVTSGVPGQPAPAGRGRMNIMARESLQESELAVEQESGASISGNSIPLSPWQDTVLPQADNKQTRTAQPAAPGVSLNSTVESRNTLASRFITGEATQQNVGQTMLPSVPTTPLSGADNGDLSRIEGEQTSLSQESQIQLEATAFFTQEQWDGNILHPSMNNSSVKQQTVDNLHQSAMSENSHSRANKRWSAVDTASQRELSPETAVPAVPPAPTIQVTIGRIEVRATQPSPTQRQTQRPGPRVMGLEEYLDRQTRGGY